MMFLLVCPRAWSDAYIESAYLGIYICICIYIYIYYIYWFVFAGATLSGRRFRRGVARKRGRGSVSAGGDRALQGEESVGSAARRGGSSSLPPPRDFRETTTTRDSKRFAAF